MSRLYDLSPLFRSSIGFERLFDTLAGIEGDGTGNWPPYNVEKTGENQYRITIAAAGFTPDDLEITAQPNLLVVNGRKREEDTDAQMLHRGIPLLAFERRFELADYVQVANASLHDGLLTIDLMREVPEAMKPKKIPVGADDAPDAAGESPRIEKRNLKRAA